MKLSELASLIEQYVEEHGDLVVAVEMEGALFPAEELVDRKSTRLNSSH